MMGNTKFTAEEAMTLKRILYGTWEYIGNDVMDAVQADGKDSMPAAHVIEVVLDADHCKMMVERLKAQALWEKFESMTYAARCAWARKYVFTSKRYC